MAEPRCVPPYGLRLAAGSAQPMWGAGFIALHKLLMLDLPPVFCERLTSAGQGKPPNNLTDDLNRFFRLGRLLF